MSFLFLLTSVLLASTPSVEQSAATPQPIPPYPHLVQEGVQEEEEVAQRSSKNSQEYNLYDRDQNRNSPDDRGQYYYYQNDNNNRRNNQKLYQRDDG